MFGLVEIKMIYEFDEEFNFYFIIDILNGFFIVCILLLIIVLVYFSRNV